MARINRCSVPFLAALFLLVGCKEEEKIPPAGEGHPTVTVDLQLAVVFLHGAHEYELASTYTDPSGVVFKLDRLRFLLSKTYVIDDDGSLLGSYPDNVLLVDAALGMNTFDLGNLTARHAHEVHWTLGLDPQQNHGDPTGAQPPLNDAALRCGPTAADGYRFLEIEGRWDSNANGEIDAADAVFAYHACGDALARPAASRIHGDLPTDGSAMLVPVRVDVKQLLQGVDVSASATADAALNDLLMSNLVTSLATEH